MRRFVGLVVAVFFGLCVLTTFVPYPPARTEAERYFDAQVIDNGLEYSLQRRLLFWSATGVELGLLLALGLTSAGPRLADAFLRLVPGSWLVALAGVGSVCFLLQHLVQFPFDVGRFYLSHAWGMTERPFLPWFVEYLLALGVEAV